MHQLGQRRAGVHAEFLVHPIQMVRHCGRSNPETPSGFFEGQASRHGLDHLAFPGGEFVQRSAGPEPHHIEFTETADADGDTVERLIVGIQCIHWEGQAATRCFWKVLFDQVEKIRLNLVIEAVAIADTGSAVVRHIVLPTIEKTEDQVRGGVD